MFCTCMIVLSSPLTPRVCDAPHVLAAPHMVEFLLIKILPRYVCVFCGPLTYQFPPFNFFCHCNITYLRMVSEQELEHWDTCCFF